MADTTPVPLTNQKDWLSHLLNLSLSTPHASTLATLQTDIKTVRTHANYSQYMEADLLHYQVLLEASLKHPKSGSPSRMYDLIERFLRDTPREKQHSNASLLLEMASIRERHQEILYSLRDFCLKWLNPLHNPVCFKISACDMTRALYSFSYTLDSEEKHSLVEQRAHLLSNPTYSDKQRLLYARAYILKHFSTAPDDFTLVHANADRLCFLIFGQSYNRTFSSNMSGATPPVTSQIATWNHLLKLSSDTPNHWTLLALSQNIRSVRAHQKCPNSLNIKLRYHHLFIAECLAHENMRSPLRSYDLICKLLSSKTDELAANILQFQTMLSIRDDQKKILHALRKLCIQELNALGRL